MKIQKNILRDIEKCYAVSAMMLDGNPVLFFAGEGNGSLRAFSGENFSTETVIWEGGGGTMSIVPIDDCSLMASRGFYSMVDSTSSTIEMIRWNGSQFTYETIAELPYLHRFGVIKAPNNIRYIVACSLADHKESKEDWSQPGRVYYARLPDDLHKSFHLTLTQLPGAYTINHGFFTYVQGSQESVLFSCQEGVYQLIPPAMSDSDWTIKSMIQAPVSDIAACDIDGDGMDEIALISPFHGNEYHIYKNIGGQYQSVYSYPVPQDFYHTVIAAQIQGQPVFIGGARKMAMELFMVSWDTGKQKFVETVIDQDVGPSNAFVFHLPDCDLILSANRQIGQAAVYTITP